MYRSCIPAPSSLLPLPLPKPPPPKGEGNREEGREKGVPHPLRTGKMAPDHRSQPRAPSANIGQTGSSRGRGGAARSTQRKDYPQRKLPKLLPGPRFKNQ